MDGILADFMIMRCPTLKDLPPPPEGKTGWPWTEETPQLPDRMPDGSPWPRISIVTPSYNQGEFIEETIRSVLLQGYPDLEYIIIDGGSTDNSVEIIKKYEPWLKYWVSEPDRGQSHAINKGFAHATGEWGNWLNSDDILLRGALENIAVSSKQASEEIFGISFGCFIVDKNRNYLTEYKISPFSSLYEFLFNSSVQPIAQPSTYVRISTPFVDEKLQYAMDWAKYFSIVEKGGKFLFFTNTPITEFRTHEMSKTSVYTKDRILKEIKNFLHSYKFRGIKNKFISMLWKRKKMYYMDMSRKGDAYIIFAIPLLYPEALISRFYLGRIKRIFLRKINI